MSKRARIVYRSAFVCPLLALTLAQSALAGQVTLRVKGGGLEVSGDLRSFDGATYVIEAPSVGTMTFDASRFECIGDNCTRRVSAPPLPAERLSADAPGRFTVRAQSPAGGVLMPALIRGYAASLGASATQIVGTTAGETRFRIADAAGAELATIVVSLGDGEAALGLSDRPGYAASQPAQVASVASPAAAASATPAQEASGESEHAVGYDGLALIVSPENPITSISEETVARIFSGQITSWSAAGVPGGTITLYTAGSASSATGVLAGLLLEPRKLALLGTVKELGSEAEVADAVARDPGGIAIVSFAFERSAKRLNLVGTCGLITRPSTFGVKSGEYPLTRRLFLSTGGVPKEAAARGLLRYAISRDAQEAIAAQDLVDEHIESLSFEEQPERMAHALNAPSQAFDLAEMKKLLGEVKGARRLSLTFRFMSGSHELDASSRFDVLRLAERMQSADMAGKTVMLIGFTDGEGRYGPNAAISLRRASQVRSAVLAAADGRIAPQAIVAKGYGPLAPIACNDTFERRQLNRRVEVWIADK